MIKNISFAVFSAVCIAACTSGSVAPVANAPNKPTEQLVDTGTGINLQKGFTATVFAEGLGTYARHLAVNDNGDIYVAYMNEKGIMALRDGDGDGSAEIVEHYENEASTEVAIHNGYLYFGSNTAVFRTKLDGNLVPQGEIETVIGGFIDQAQHAAKTFTFDTEGHIYVNIGAPSNACQGESRTAGAPGLDPCPQLDLQSGIWQFDADKLGQVHGQDGKRYNTGVRNAMALDWNHEDDTLYFATHGRDQLSGLWPEIYSDDDNTEMPAESFFRAEEGLDAGWPYTFFDPQSNQRFKAPEYGGKHKELAEAGKFKDPDIAFPAHWAPNDPVFYDHKTFPKHYHGGAFLAFQGSWNRAPNPQAGYNVVFIPFRDGRPTGEYQIFADGFEGDVPVMSPRDALYRPCGVAVGPDGALYISDIIRGRIWKVTYQN